MRDPAENLSHENFMIASQRIRDNYPKVVLLLQGGGALGSYQAGVAEMLDEADVPLHWVAGISIGAINSAIIAGNAPGDRVQALQGFWDRITSNVKWPFIPEGDDLRAVYNHMAAWTALTAGAAGFFAPRFAAPYFQPRGAEGAVSFYDTSELKHTLEEFADFDRINNGPMRLSVGAVNVRSGNFIYFDTTERTIKAEHIMASGALPPGFPPVEIENELYWDGGLVSNTPLQHVMEHLPTDNTLILQVDLFSARGPRPRTIEEVEERAKDIRFSSRTRLNSSLLAQAVHTRRQIQDLLAMLPPDLAEHPTAAALRELPKVPKFNLVHLIYRAKLYEAANKDYEFSHNTMRDHWQSGYAMMKRSLRNVNWFNLPAGDTHFVRHDVDSDSRD